MAVWGTGQVKPAASMTEDQAKALVAMIVAGLTEANKSELIEQFRRTAQTQVDLEREREITARLRADVDALRQHIATLQGVLASMTPGLGGGYPSTQQIPTFDQRVAASIPVPVPGVTIRENSIG